VTRQRDIEEQDNPADLRGPDCPACHDPLGVNADRHRCRARRR